MTITIDTLEGVCSIVGVCVSTSIAILGWVRANFHKKGKVDAYRHIDITSSLLRIYEESLYKINAPENVIEQFTIIKKLINAEKNK